MWKGIDEKENNLSALGCLHLGITRDAWRLDLVITAIQQPIISILVSRDKT